MHRRGSVSTLVLVVGGIGSAVVAGAGRAMARPVGPLPDGPTAAIQAQTGELIAFALPHRPNGRVWPIAKPVHPKVLQEVSEADVGNEVVLVFTAAVVAFGLTRGERQKAFESRRFSVSVRP